MLATVVEFLKFWAMLVLDLGLWKHYLCFDEKLHVCFDWDHIDRFSITHWFYLQGKTLFVPYSRFICTDEISIDMKALWLLEFVVKRNIGLIVVFGMHILLSVVIYISGPLLDAVFWILMVWYVDSFLDCSSLC